MKNILHIEIPLLIVAFLLYGCPVPSGTEKGSEPRPDITIQIASLNLGAFNKRIEKKHISNLVKKLRDEKVEVLAIQELIRYPGIATRVDFIDEFNDQTEWRSAFGEMANLSGNQKGNAVFSSYPIISNYNQSFDAVKSSQFEAALLATVDAGVNTLTVVSATLPVKSTTDEYMQCIKLINKSVSDKNERLLVISGNLPSSESVRNANLLKEVIPTKQYSQSIPKVWYSAGEHIRLLNSRVVETDLANLLL